ncbi:hypothetical protein [Citrobacter portucalensis]|nr:hypothetical protein [Citrobacter portucalensis]
MTVFEYIQAHPNTTSGGVARGLNKKHPLYQAQYPSFIPLVAL